MIFFQSSHLFRSVICRRPSFRERKLKLHWGSFTLKTQNPQNPGNYCHQYLSWLVEYLRCVSLAPFTLHLNSTSELIFFRMTQYYYWFYADDITMKYSKKYCFIHLINHTKVLIKLTEGIKDILTFFLHTTSLKCFIHWIQACLTKNS